MRIHERDLTPALRHELGIPPAPKRSKYRAVPTVYNGVRYASKAEARRAQELDRLQAIGSVVWWIGQPKFRLGCPENVYIADFLVAELPPGLIFPNRVMVFADDVKGVRTDKFRRDVNLWRRYGRMPLRIIGAKGVKEIITPEYLA